METEEIEQHESYGMAGFSRVSSSHGANFFGSSIRSSHYIELTIRRAERKRNLSQYWYHGREELINVRFSPNQFADLLTSLNVGSGTPCTIQHVNRVRMAPCPAIDQRQQYEAEFKKDVADTVREASELVKSIKTAFEKPSLGKKERAEIAKQLDLLVGHIRGGMPFIQSQFNEAMDKTVTEAKGEVEAFVNHKIHSLGIAALNSEVAQALQAPLESQPLQLPEAAK
jgi:hypothetical protein